MSYCSGQTRKICMQDRECLTCCLKCSMTCNIRCEISERENIRKGLKFSSKFTEKNLFSEKKQFPKRTYLRITRKEIIELYSKRVKLYKRKQESEDILTFESKNLSDEQRDMLFYDIEEQQKAISLFWKQTRAKTKIPCIKVLDIAFTTFSYLNLKNDDDVIEIAID